MEEDRQHFHHIMVYCFKKGKSTPEMQEKIHALYGKVLWLWMCQKWLAKFHAGDFSLDDAPQLDRQVEVDSNQIET